LFSYTSPSSPCFAYGSTIWSSTIAASKNAMIVSRSAATSAGDFAERRIASGYFARRAARSASLTRSILLRSRRDGTAPAPISRSTLRLTSSCDSYVGSDASTTNSSSDASSASASVDRNDATRSCGSFLMNPTVSETSTRGVVSRLQRAHRRVKRREEFVRDQHRAARECTHERRLPCVRVPDQRDPELIATRGPTLVVVSLDVLELLFQLREAIADLAAIEIETGLARAGALLPPAARRGLPQARRDVPQPRDLHLQLRLEAVGMTMEDLHDHAGPIEP